ncbi:tripartite tricarboxylate transporter substrate-binding protein [Chelativorans sp. Marseille-P2723]|uniref:tripartite tricarboxylate transporter substrate-binding protein n=1 Tax=Chelativorans sp. Marseille-P2723 TaxID=2709133 RepID=UPI001FEF865D|nr:tripartite tricarboxylate transporter substrate-binding protein [Chelativorans sp. Marseille-P2723]
MGRALGQSVIVENRPGANGQVGVSSVAQAQPDGYTVLFSATNCHHSIPCPCHL